MSPLVVIGLVLLAKPAAPKAPVSLPMPPPPAVAKPPPKPAEPPPPPPESQAQPEAPAPRVKEKAAPQDRPLLSRIQVGAAVGPGFSLSAGFTGSNNSPVWLRGVIRGTFDLLRAGPGDLQLLLPVGLQSTRFNAIVQGSIFGMDVMPSIRYQAEVLPDVSLFGEFGLGFGSFQTTIQQQFQGYLTFGAGGFGVRLGGGLEYRLMDQLRLVIQPLEVTNLTVTTTVTVGGTTVTTTASAAEWSMIFGAVYPL